MNLYEVAKRIVEHKQYLLVKPKAEQTPGQPLQYVLATKSSTGRVVAILEDIGEQPDAIPDKPRKGSKWFMFDLFSAQYVVAVYEALNEANRANLLGREAAQVVNICFKLAK